jgi:hypothetical protein
MMRSVDVAAVFVVLTWLASGCQRSGGEAGSTGAATGAAMSEDTVHVAPGDSTRRGIPALIEFTRDVRDDDLSWLRENGFQVDTVMGPRTVRGRLMDTARGEVIARDPRVASIDALTR